MEDDHVSILEINSPHTRSSQPTPGTSQLSSESEDSSAAKSDAIKHFVLTADKKKYSCNHCS